MAPCSRPVVEPAGTGREAAVAAFRADDHEGGPLATAGDADRVLGTLDAADPGPLPGLFGSAPGRLVKVASEAKGSSAGVWR
jgi:hypothetical protein